MPLMNMPSELIDAAESQDAVIGEALAETLTPPEKPYSIKAFNALINALNAVTRIMGVEEALEEVTDSVSAWEPDEVRFLSMVEAAAADYGAPLPVALDQIKGDAEITALAAHLMKLSEDEEFLAFLETDVEEEGVEGDVEEEEFDFGSRI